MSNDRKLTRTNQPLPSAARRGNAPQAATVTSIGDRKKTALQKEHAMNAALAAFAALDDDDRAEAIEEVLETYCGNCGTELPEDEDAECPNGCDDEDEEEEEEGGAEDGPGDGDEDEDEDESDDEGDGEPE